jgi:hypothetical protein
MPKRLIVWRSVPCFAVGADAKLVQSERPIDAYSGVLTGVIVSAILEQRGQMNTCNTACFDDTRLDRDHVISRSHEMQIGAFSSATDRLRVSICRALVPGTGTHP